MRNLSAEKGREKKEYHPANVTIAVLNYNGIKILGDCLASIGNLNAPPGEILLVDDGSDDGSRAWVREHYPGIRVIEMGFNSRRLNRVRNRALSEAAKDFVLLVDNDVHLKPDCLDELLSGLQTLARSAVCMPRALYSHDHAMIYQDGQILHYVGASRAIHRNERVENVDPGDGPRLSIGWGVQLIDKHKASEMGNFNEDYVMGWGDDGEFNHRMNLSGNFCYHVPSAIVYHKRVAGARRYYGTLRNRWRFLLECYQWKTLLLCLPALAAYELSLFLFLLSKGAAADYFRAMGYLFSNLKSIFTTRARVQSRRTIRDGELMTCGSVFIDQGYVDSRILKYGYTAMNSFLNGYWFLVSRFV